jgi:2-polyprenyl-6-methoxyphenol hydroxylase-like FAD-dependent oxidoreductase
MMPHSNLVDAMCPGCVQVDPILAQGAGVAIEDAYELAWQLSRGASPANALLQYERATAGRAKILKHISDLSQALGQMSSAKLIAARDALLVTTPGFVKGPVFDAMIRLSVSREVTAWLRPEFGYSIPPFVITKDQR